MDHYTHNPLKVQTPSIRSSKRLIISYKLFKQEHHAPLHQLLHRSKVSKSAHISEASGKQVKELSLRPRKSWRQSLQLCHPGGGTLPHERSAIRAKTPKDPCPPTPHTFHPKWPSTNGRCSCGRAPCWSCPWGSPQSIRQKPLFLKNQGLQQWAPKPLQKQSQTHANSKKDPTSPVSYSNLPANTKTGRNKTSWQSLLAPPCENAANGYAHFSPALIHR